MEPYDAKLAPHAFGLHNTGNICHFNSLLQALLGCTALLRTALLNADYLRRTQTGTAFLSLVEAVATTKPGAEELSQLTTQMADLHIDVAIKPKPGVEELSSKLLTALMADLRTRRPRIRFGASQESASEGLVLLLDMMEPGDTKDESPITRLFQHRYRLTTICPLCRGKGESVENTGVHVSLFHLDDRKPPVDSPKSFVEAVTLQYSPAPEYKCTHCKKLVTAMRIYRLTMIPEILVFHRNLYSTTRREAYVPTEELSFKAAEGKQMLYRPVGHVRHYGSLAGGHYTALGLRTDDTVHLFNDSSVSPIQSFQSATDRSNTYIIVYHYESTT